MKKFTTIAALAIFAIAGSASAASLADFGTSTLMVGSRGAAVMSLQSCVGASPVDGVFGNGTKAKVMAFQTMKGLMADGIAGNATKNACVAGTTTTTTTSTTTTSTTETPSTTTSSSNDNGALEGGAGDIDSISTLSSYNNEKVKEGAEDTKIFGFEVEASDDSDIALSSVKLAFNNGGSGSTRLNRYLSEVKVWKGSDEVGSADAEDFSRTSSKSSKSITLEDAIVRAGEKVKFYVSVSAVDSIDSTDISGSSWTLDLEQTRFEDADGVVSTDTTALSAVPFDFEDGASSSTVEAKF